MDEEYLKKLIKKYITGTATEQEKNELLAWYRSKDDEEFTLPYESADEEEEAKERMLYMLRQHIFARKGSFFNKSLYLKIAAAAILLIGTCFFLYKNLPAKHTDIVAVTYSTITTQRGEHKIIKLTDGSVIYLSAGSKVKFPSEFDGATREIAFEGEAFFEIAKDKKHPFIVHTGKTSTRVLGTSFNITARENQPNITVALITGKVAFTDGKSQSALLPGHLVSYNKNSGKLKVKPIPDVKAITNRKDGDYEYNNVKVGVIAEDLNMNFDANITIEGGVKNCDFFGRIKADESVSSFLERLAVIENAKIIKTDKGYLIKGGGCN